MMALAQMKYNKVNLLLLAIVCILFMASSALSQPNELTFKKITTKDGLSNELVNCVIQDQFGYMWFGTDEGLNRFDGYENKIFKRILNDPTSIQENHIICLYQDTKKRLWIGTLNGLSLYNYQQETFTNFLPDNSGVNLNTVNRITGIKEDSKNNLYITTESGSLCVLQDDSLTLYKSFSQDAHVKSFLIDNYDNFWVGSLNKILIYNNQKDEIQIISDCYLNGKRQALGWVYTMLVVNDTIWFGTDLDQFGFIPRKTMKAELVNFVNFPLSIIQNIYRDKDGYFYISSGAGLFIMNNQKKLIGNYNYQRNNPDGISNNTVMQTYKDNQGNLWVGTALGVNLAMNGKKFNNYNPFSQKYQLNILGVARLMIDSKDNLWMGSFDGGLGILNLKTGSGKLFKNDINNPNSIGGGSITSIFEDSKNNIWVGSYLSYLRRYNPSNGQFIPYTFNHAFNGRTIAKDVRYMVEDKEGNFWIVVHGFGLFKFNPVNNTFKYFVNDPNNIQHSLPDNWSYQLQLMDDSILWIATPSGLSKLNIKTEYFTNYFNNPLDSTSLSNNHVNLTYVDGNNNLWIGTFFGLNFYNKKTNSFEHFYEKDGLPSNQIKSIIEEKPGALWMGTGYGLTRMSYTIDNKTGTPVIDCKNFDRYDNLQDVFFYEHSVVKTKSGEFLFGTKNGILAFYPQNIHDNMQPPAIYFTDFLLFNKNVKVGDYDSLLRQNISFTKEIKLKYNQDFFTFKYAAINYIATEKNQYAYKMVGFDKDWNYVGDKREATYTNLSPGSYQFVVIASNNDGYWNKTGASINIIITPPWWKTLGFRIFGILLLIGILVLIYFLRIQMYRKQEAHLKILVKERTYQLEEIAASLEERQEEINSQKEELMSQRDELTNVNKVLLGQQQKIIEQNIELDTHRNKLETIVEERTRELIEAKNKAEESDRLKSSFLANLSHEIRTPLNAILGFSNMLGEQDLTEGERKQFNSIVQNSSNNLLELISDILDISKIEAGQMEIVKRPTSLSTIIKGVAETFTMLMARQETDYAKEVQFITNVEQEILDTNLLTDPLRLEQVLSNLINNAIKFTRKGYIELGCRKISNTKFLEFYVKDTGIGIKEENLELIFERFRKLEEDKNQLHRGTGLGLAISSQLVHLLGGSITLQSTYGEGSRFSFTIPFIKADGSISSSQSHVHDDEIPLLPNIEILVAEDDISNFMYIEKLLKKTQAKIYHALNGKEVLFILKKHPGIRLVLMDIKMPVMDGIETLHEIKKMGMQVPVIAQTAHAYSDEVLKIKQVGFDEYIAKPINPVNFYQKIKNSLKIL